MGKRSAPAAAEQELEDPGILADDSSGEELSGDYLIGEDAGANSGGSGAAEEAGNSDVDAGADSDAQSLSADEQEQAEAAGNSSHAAAAAAGDADTTAATAADVDSDLELDLDLDADNPSSSGGSGDSDLEPGSSASEHEDDDSPADDNTKQQRQAASFLDGGKSASFAKAFAKIMAKPAKAASASAKDVILSESAGLAKWKAEVEADDAAAHQSKKQRQEMRKRGHFKVPRKGEDPAHDVREKQLLKLATRGVVLLFNAVNKAQKQKQEAEAAGMKAPKGKAAAASKAGFLAELKAKSAKVVAGGEQLVPAGPSAAAGGSLQQGQQQQHGGSGWEVLGEGFPGLTGGVKMKDWDKAAGSDEEANGQALAGSDDDSDSGGEGW